MKIITNNYKPDYPKSIVCTNVKCKSVLEYEKSDVQTSKVMQYDQRQGDYEVTIKSIECPCCKSIIIIKD